MGELLLILVVAEGETGSVVAIERSGESACG